MAERIVSMHAAYKSGAEVVDGFRSRGQIMPGRKALPTKRLPQSPWSRPANGFGSSSSRL